MSFDLHAIEPLQHAIENAFKEILTLTPENISPVLRTDLMQCLAGLQNGTLRVAERNETRWHVNEWLKKAILLAFRAFPNKLLPQGHSQSLDKVPLQFTEATYPDLEAQRIRIVPGAVVRIGAYVGQNSVVMPSFINIGAYIGSGCMIDTWATVGSCAQIGKNVHLSGGAGIGGVLEPLQANPTIIEDNCFIGARSEIVEGVVVEENSVISMGVFLGQSTRIYNRLTGEISFGRVPKGSVVVPGSLPSAEGKYSLACAVIVKQVDEKTRQKTSLNELLRFQN